MQQKQQQKTIANSNITAQVPASSMVPTSTTDGEEQVEEQLYCLSISLNEKISDQNHRIKIVKSDGKWDENPNPKPNPTK